MARKPTVSNGDVTISSSLSASMLGDFLRRRRESRGWSLGELAAASGVGKSILSRLESGQMRTARDANLEALARVFEVPVEALKDLGQRPASPPPHELLSFLEGRPPIEEDASETRFDQETVLDSIRALQDKVRSSLATGDWEACRQAVLRLEEIVELTIRLPELVETELRLPLKETVNHTERQELRQTIEGMLRKFEHSHEAVGDAEPSEPDVGIAEPENGSSSGGNMISGAVEIDA